MHDRRPEHVLDAAAVAGDDLRLVVVLVGLIAVDRVLPVLVLAVQLLEQRERLAGSPCSRHRPRTACCRRRGRCCRRRRSARARRGGGRRRRATREGDADASTKPTATAMPSARRDGEALAGRSLRVRRPGRCRRTGSAVRPAGSTRLRRDLDDDDFGDDAFALERRGVGVGLGAGVVGVVGVAGRGRRQAARRLALSARRARGVGRDRRRAQQHLPEPQLARHSAAAGSGWRSRRGSRC